MPIDGISDRPGLPRVGKIHLGIMAPNKNTEGVHPEAVDYFVFPESIRKVVGEKPKVLDIQFPVDDRALFAPQYLKCYASSQGLVCFGDGKTATRKIDVKTEAIAGKNTTDWVRKPVTCDRAICPQYQNGECHPAMSLYFCLLSVPGVGVWQLDTRSTNSMRNINNTVDIILELVGAIRWLPLQLSLEPRDVEPEGKKKMTVQVLKLSCPESIIDLRKLVPPGRRIEAPKEPDEDEPGDGEPEIIDTRVTRPVTKSGAPSTEKAPPVTKTGTLVTEKAENATRTGTLITEKAPPVVEGQGKAWEELGHQEGPKTPPSWLAVKQEQIVELKDLFKMAAVYFKVSRNGRMVPISSADVVKELGYTSQFAIKETPWECWKILISSRGE